ncbi:MAG: AraC family transcriptional regulator [Acidobacteria bacterium]|nr:AraC family transcriptional regulator [Acidobacteriota bacterium]MYG76355.1 AraC family transcriptional regulator [Acidobacteriota bacterium]
MAVRYREFAVHEALAPHVRLIWLLECNGPALFGGPERIVADGVVEAIFHYRTPFAMRFADAEATRQPVSLLVSQTRRFVEIEPAGAGGFIAVRFHPWGAHQFLPVPMLDVADRATPADEVWRRPDVREIEERIGTAATDAERVNALQAFLLRHLEKHRRPDVSGLVRTLWRAPPPVRIDRIADSLGIGQRRLERTFETSLGMTPKHLTRLTRFLRACRSLREAPDARLTGVACDAGFYDQAHFIHEFRAFAGMTPGRFAANARVSALEVD